MRAGRNSYSALQRAFATVASTMMCHKVDEFGHIVDDNGDDTGLMSEDDDGDADTLEDATEKKTAAKKLGPFLNSLTTALTAGVDVKEGFQRDRHGVYHYNMPAAALACIALLNPDDLRKHAENYAQEIDKDSGSSLIWGMVGCTDPNRIKTPCGAAFDDNEQLDPSMCKYNVCQQGGAVRSLLTPTYGATGQQGLAKARDTDQQARALAFRPGANARNLPGLLGITEVVIGATQAVLTDADDVKCEWVKRMATMSHPASDAGLISTKGLGIHRDKDSPYALHALVHTGEGHSATLFYIDGKWSALIFVAGVSA